MGKSNNGFKVHKRKATSVVTEEKKPKVKKSHVKNEKINDPVIEPNEFFSWMISPTSEKDFFQSNWEKAPLHLKRNNDTYYKGWFSKDDFDRILKTSYIKYGVNLDVVKYENGERKTLTPTGRAYPSSAWGFFEDGCSLRLLNPQTFCEPVWRMISILQEYFTCGLGTNIYLTPAKTQGFAPHFDDIEAFVLQLEGSKRWRVYKPPRELPKYSSKNLKEEDLDDPVLDVVLHPGDMLYFPRGWVHQANATDTYSLHITVSTYQDNSWGTLFEKAIPQALKSAFANSVGFRKGLPVGYLDYMGVSKYDENCERRENFEKNFFSLWDEMIPFVELDEACDQMGIKYLEDCYRPVLSQKEINETSAAGVNNNDVHDKTHHPIDEIDEHSSIRLIRKNVARLVRETENICVYHCLENSRVYHEEKPQKLEFPFDTEEILQHMMNAYPKPVELSKIPCEDVNDVVDIAVALYDFGLMIVS